MNPTELQLARELVASPKWKWQRGMILESGAILCEVGRHDELIIDDGEEIEPGKGSLPDISHPATKGILIEMIREAWESPAAQVSPWVRMIKGKIQISSWRCCINDMNKNDSVIEASTEAEALAKAWLAAREDAR